MTDYGVTQWSQTWDNVGGFAIAYEAVKREC